MYWLSCEFRSVGSRTMKDLTDRNVESVRNSPQKCRYIYDFQLFFIYEGFFDFHTMKETDIKSLADREAF